MKKFLLGYSIIFLATHSYSQTREPVKVTDMLKIRSSVARKKRQNKPKISSWINNYSMKILIKTIGVFLKNVAYFHRKVKNLTKVNV